MLNLDLLKQLNKQNQWQYNKITRSPKVAHRLQSYLNQRITDFSTEKAESEQKIEISITRIRSQYKKIHRSERFHHSKPLDLSSKENSPRADRKIQSLLLPEGSNQDTFTEKKARCKKICRIRNIANPLLAYVLLPDSFCNKNNASSVEATKTQKIAPADRKSFGYGFHQLSIKTTRMAAI